MSTTTVIERKQGAFNDLVFEVDLSDYGKDNTDVDDIFFSVKSALTDDDDALLLKTYQGGGITFTGTTILTVSVSWPYNEYSQFTLDENYRAGLFVKFTGDPVADENVEEVFYIKIVQDFLKDN